MEELPALQELGTRVLTQAVMQLIRARKVYVGSVTKELLAIMEVRGETAVNINTEARLGCFINICIPRMCGKYILYIADIQAEGE